jgi:hypothetical protein
MNRGRVGDDRGSKETDGCPLTIDCKGYHCVQKRVKVLLKLKHCNSLVVV